jgi:hypothetical protein
MYMPISCNFDEQSQVWFIKPGESFLLSDVLDMIDATDWKGSKSFLWDFCNVQKGPDSSPEIRDAADQVAKVQDLWSGSRVAIFVTRDLDFGIARMFSAFVEGLDIDYQVFREESAALEWLSSSKTPS